MTEQEAFMHSMVKEFPDMAGSFPLPFFVFHRGPEGGVYQWEVARSDGAIVCGCTSEEAAGAVFDALKTHKACRDIVGVAVAAGQAYAGEIHRALAERDIIEQVGAA